MYNEAWQRGWSRADKKVIIADGAVWIWNIADREFPGAVQIVDLYHAREHLWVLAGKLMGTYELSGEGSAGPPVLRRNSKRAKSSSSSNTSVRFLLSPRKPKNCCALKPTTSNAIGSA